MNHNNPIPPNYRPEDEFSYKDFRNLVKDIFRDVKKLVLFILTPIYTYLLKPLVPGLTPIIRSLGNSLKEYRQKITQISLLGSLIFAVYLFISYSYDFGKLRPTYGSAIWFIANETNVSQLGEINEESVSANFLLGNFAFVDAVNQTLLDKVSVDDTLDYIANHLIRNYNLHDEWKNLAAINDQKDLERVEELFIKTGDIEKFDPNDTRTLILVKDLFFRGLEQNSLSNNILMITRDTTTEVFRIIASTRDSELSLELCNRMYNNIVEQYKTRKEELTSLSLRTLNETADSVLNQLHNASIDLDEISEVLDEERGQLMPEILKSNLQLQEIRPDEFLSKEMLLYFGITSDKYVSISNLTDEVLEKIQNLRFKIKSRKITFEILKQTPFPKKEYAKKYPLEFFIDLTKAFVFTFFKIFLSLILLLFIWSLLSSSIKKLGFSK